MKSSYKHQFKFNGGVFSSGLKFLSMMMLPNGSEEFIYGLEKSGYVIKGMVDSKTHENTYYTNLDVAKIIITQPLQYNQRLSQNFYVRFSEEEHADLLRVTPLPDERNTSVVSQCYFEGYGRFLTRNEVLSILPEGSSSIKYVRLQRLPPKELLRQMVTIKRSTLRIEGRAIALPDISIE